MSPPASSWGEARQAQPSYYKFQNSDNPYYYPRAAGQGAQYPYAGYSLQYPVGPSNGVYPGAYYPGYPGQAGQYACGPLPPAPLSAEVEQQMRSMQQQELGKLLREAGNQEQQLSNLLSRDRISPEGLEKMAQLRLVAGAVLLPARGLPEGLGEGDFEVLGLFVMCSWCLIAEGKRG